MSSLLMLPGNSKGPIIILCMPQSNQNYLIHVSKTIVNKLKKKKDQLYIGIEIYTSAYE